MTAAAALAGLAGDGCSDKAMPGTPLGTFNVTGTLTVNTCGAGVNAPNPWTFQVDLSLDGSTLYWSWKDGSPYLTGQLSSGQASLVASQTATDTVEAGTCPTTPNYGGWFGESQTSTQCTSTPDCSMTRSDAYAVSMASTMKAFTGTLSYAFAISSGTCSGDYASAGGPYATLPCTITYTLSASQ